MSFLLRFFLKWATGVAIVFVVSGAVSTTLEDANKAFQSGDCTKAERLFHLKATQGSPQAQFQLGQFYSSARCGQNAISGLDWIEMAAGQGFNPAETELGIRYLLGDGFSQDTETGLYWLNEGRVAPTGNYEQNGVDWNTYQPDLW